MGLLDFFRKKKQKEQKNSQEEARAVIDDEKINAILEEEIKEFFPNEGAWYSNCFKKSREVTYENLPCHLRDNAWLSELLHNNLNNKGIYIPKNKIKKFMDNSETFAKLRHEYELRIVKWQIDWIIGRGDNWLLPNDYDELSIYYSEDVDEIIRGGVVKTLQAIGMDRDVIEEGLEKYADTWRPCSMNLGFINLYQPICFMIEPQNLAGEEHENNWLADREYKYYQKHKDSVDKYGTPTSAMKMTAEEHAKLVAILKKQNADRINFIKNWKKNRYKNDSGKSNEDALEK